MNIKKISDKELERRMEFARQEAARVYGKPETSGKEVDAVLLESFADILVYHMYEPHLGCATTEELIDEIKARVDLDYKTLGDEAL